MTTYKHVVQNSEALEVLETVFDIYKSCGLTNSYSGAVGIAVEEFYGKRGISMKNLILCTSRMFLKGKLSFPLMRRWKEIGHGLIIKDISCSGDYCINEWKRVPGLASYVEKRLVETVPIGINDRPEQKTLILGEEAKIGLLNAKENLNLETVDEALMAILNKSAAMRFVVMLTRLLFNELTINEAHEAFGDFGSFYYVFAFERDDEHIKVVHEFFPYVYSVNVTGVIA